MISEERFFQNVKEQFQGFAPNVPSSVYKGMRRKLWMSNFLSFSASRMNVWYLLLLAGATTAAVLLIEQPEISAQKIGAQPRNIELTEVVPTVPVTFNCTDETVALACCSESKKVVSHKHASSSVENAIVNAGNSGSDKTHTDSTPETKTVDTNIPETLVAENPAEVATPTATIEPMVPMKPKRVNVPAPLFDQLNSSKKELRLLVDIIRYTETTSKN